MAASGFDEAHVAHALEQTWVWRISSSVRQMKRLCVLAFRCSRRNASSAARCARAFSPSAVKVWRSRGTGAAPSAARNVVSHSLICGSPATVAERLATIKDTGVGGVILQFRVGPSPYEITERNIHLFMEQVAPELT